MLKCQPNNQSSTPSFKLENNQRKKTKQPKEATLYKKYATPDRPPPAAAMLTLKVGTNFNVSNTIFKVASDPRGVTEGATTTPYPLA